MRNLKVLLLHALLGIAVNASPLVAQSSPDTSRVTTARDEAQQWYFDLHSLGAATPTGWFLGFGLQRPPTDRENRGGLLAVAEIGLSGSRFSLGVGGATYGSGAQLRISAIRTYGDPWGVPPNRTLIGPEVRLSANMLTVGVGAYSQQGAVPAADRWLIAFMTGLTVYLPR